MHDLETMPARLTAFLATVRPELTANVTSYALMTGGYSRVMAKAEVQWSNGTSETLVLRGDPPADKTMLVTDRDAEWAVLNSLSNVSSIPMPKALHYDATGEHLGTKAIVLEFCSGPSLQAQLNDLVTAGVPLDDPRFAVIRDAFVDTIARVPQVDLGVLPAAVAVPSDWNAYVGSVNRSWADNERLLAESNPTMRYLSAWLDAHRPPPMPLVLQHGDLQPANILVDPTDGGHRLIDWEYAHIGDPREDLGWYVTYSAAAGPGLYGIDPDAFLARYREKTGASELHVNQATVGYFSVVSAVKVFSGIVQAMDAMGKGQNSGVMTTYNINAATIGHMNFVAACAGLAEPIDMLRGMHEQMVAAAGGQS
jgi:aminoglycoside phosphotransferase (APT) family kinase protein